MTGDLEMGIYPNPTATTVKVELNLIARSDIRIDVFDFAGRLLMTKNTGMLPMGTQEVTIDVHTLNEGTYLMQCTAGSASVTRKFIVVK
jgi:hypothetical protein